MRTQAESDRRIRRRPPAAPFDTTGPLLYLLTLAGEGALGATTRWLLASLGAAAAGLFVPLGPAAEPLAWSAALAPLAFSALALAWPGRGALWGRQLGTRRPSGEEAMAINDATQLLRDADPGHAEPAIHVLDDPLPGAAARGGAIVLSRGLLETDSLAAVLAHELGHARSLDARLTEALQRLQLWDDPLGPAEPRHGAEPPAAEADPPRGIVAGSLRWLLRLAGGGCAEALLGPLWAAHWRGREHAADAHAARLGQAEDLARHLADHELPFDQPHRRGLFDRAAHPPVAHRIERLTRQE